MLLKPKEEVFETDVRCRTIGDITCTGVTLSRAGSLEEMITEIAATVLLKEAAGTMINVRKPQWRTGRRKGIFEVIRVTRVPRVTRVLKVPRVLKVKLRDFNM